MSAKTATIEQGTFFYFVTWQEMGTRSMTVAADNAAQAKAKVKALHPSRVSRMTGFSARRTSVNIYA